MSEQIRYEINLILGDLAFGMTLSGIVSKMIPEIIHASVTISIGLTTTTLVFFLQRLLRKKFPEKK